MPTFPEYLAKNVVPEDLQSVLLAVLKVAKKIQKTLQKGVEERSGKVNATGDEQVAMDVVSNELLVEALRQNSIVSLVGSEELAEPLETGNDEGLSVVFDPLDGSSLVDVNLAVGTIVGVYKGKSLLGKRGRDQLASLIVVYGPRLTCMMTVGKGVAAFSYDPEQDAFVLVHDQLKLQQQGKIMAPGNIKIAATDPWYFRMLEEMAKDGYALRYSGGMVPDVQQILLKGGGVYMYPGSQSRPEGKLRLLYECAPLAFLMEQAGGKAIATQENILDIEIQSFHQRTPIFLGSSAEIERVQSYLQRM